MIKIKNAQVNNYMVNVINQLIEMDLPIKASFKISKVVKEFQNLLEMVRISHDKILQKYAKKDEKGNPLQRKDDKGNVIPGQIELEEANVQKYNSEVSELMEVENVIQGDQVTLDELGDVNIKPNMLLPLEWLIKQE